MDKILIDPHYCHKEEYKELTDYLETNHWNFNILGGNMNDSAVVKDSFDILISTIEDLITQMPLNGNTASECQRINLQEKINRFQYAVNAIEDEDLKEREEK